MLRKLTKALTRRERGRKEAQATTQDTAGHGQSMRGRSEGVLHRVELASIYEVHTQTEERAMKSRRSMGGCTNVEVNIIHQIQTNINRIYLGIINGSPQTLQSSPRRWGNRREERGLLRGSSFFPGIVVVIKSDMSPNSAF